MNYNPNIGKYACPICKTSGAAGWATADCIMVPASVSMDGAGESCCATVEAKTTCYEWTDGQPNSPRIVIGDNDIIRCHRCGWTGQKKESAK